jgi:hypothetical protein
MAICVEGHVGRFSATQFGHKVSNTGLAVITDAVVVYASHTLQVDSGAFVDDFLKSVGVKAHKSCQGLEGGCPTCSASLPAAQASMDSLDQMMHDCALVFRTKGDRDTCSWASFSTQSRVEFSLQRRSLTKCWR